jgi:hypothetical protein
MNERLEGHTPECGVFKYQGNDCTCGFIDQMKDDAWEHGLVLFKHDASVNHYLEKAREIWGNRNMNPGEIVTVLMVIAGDLARQVRNLDEGRPFSDEQFQKELGNVILSCIRWADDLGYHPDMCIEMAMQSQSEYVTHHGASE